MRKGLFFAFLFLFSSGFAQTVRTVSEVKPDSDMALDGAETLFLQGIAAIKKQPVEGIVPLTKARFLFKKQKNSEREVDCILALAEVHMRLSDYDVAYSLLTNAASISLDLNLPDQHLMSLVSLGRLSAYLGNYVRSVGFFKDSYKLSEELSRSSQMLLSRGYVSYINLYYLQDYADSNFVNLSRLYEKASLKPIDTLMIGVAANMLAGAYNLVKRNPSKSAYYYQESIRFAELSGDKYRASLVSNNLAEMWIRAGNYPEAERILFHSLATAREINSKLLIYNCFRLLSRCAEFRGDFVEALKFYKMYGELKDEVLNENLIRRTQENYALFILERKEREAERIAREKTISQMEAKRRIRNYQWVSIVIFVVLIALVVLTFLFRRRVQQFRRQNLIIEDQNRALQKLNLDLMAQKKSAQDANAAAELAIQSKIDFLSIMTHEIRTPIHAVLGTVQLLQEDNPPANQHRSLEILRFSADNLLNLVNDILDFNKIEAGKVELDNQPFSLRILVQNIKNSLQFKADEKAIELKVRVDRNLPEAFIGDRLRIGQIFYNLISNALKFTEKGKVEIEIRYQPNEKDKNIFVQIKDTGIGIEPEKQETIFDFFSQAEPGITGKFGGSGLGLTITKNLLLLMDSKIELQSTPGKGSCFSFALHLLETNPAFLNEFDDEKQEKHLDFANTLTLFVEDVEFNRVIAERFFKKWNLKFDTATTSGQAVEYASEKRYDLILMDLQLPDQDGFETVRRIRSHYLNKETPVLAMTASGFVEIREKLIRNGMDGYISKPIIAAEFRKIISEWLIIKKRKSLLP